MKTCKKCGQTKELKHYHKQGTGLNSQCKECRNQYRRSLAHMQKLMNTLNPVVTVTEQQCCDCELVKPVAAFSKNIQKPNGVREVCRQCDNTRRQQWREKNRPLHRASNHRRRARKKGCEIEPIAPDVLNKVLSGPCAYCGTDSGPFTIDHIVPLARGGSHSLENLVSACESCNFTKKDKLLFHQWWPKLGTACQLWTSHGLKRAS